MYVACLMPTDALAAEVSAHLSLAGMDLRLCDDPQDLQHELQHGFFQAVLVEDTGAGLAETLRPLRERFAGDEWPIVVVASRADAHAAQRAYEGGACDYVGVSRAADLPMRLAAHCAARRMRARKQQAKHPQRRDPIGARRHGGEPSSMRHLGW